MVGPVSRTGVIGDSNTDGAVAAASLRDAVVDVELAV